MTAEELFFMDVRVIDESFDTEYQCVARPDEYEIDKCTAERMGPDGRTNYGAVLVHFNDGRDIWIPKSVTAVDSDHNLYVETWFFLKHFGL